MRCGNCNGFTTPVHLSGPPFALAPAALSSCGLTNEARARAPRLAPDFLRKARRLISAPRNSEGPITSVPGDGFVQVENDSGGRSPGGQFGLVGLVRHFAFADLEQVRRRRRIVFVLLP